MPAIVSDPKIMGGELVFEGTRVTAKRVAKLAIAGVSYLEIKQDYPMLSDDDISAARALYKDKLGDWVEDAVKLIGSVARLHEDGYPYLRKHSEAAAQLVGQYKYLRLKKAPQEFPYSLARVRDSIIGAVALLEEQLLVKDEMGRDYRCRACGNECARAAVLFHTNRCPFRVQHKRLKQVLEMLQPLHKMSAVKMLDACERHGWDWEADENDDFGEIVIRTGLFYNDDDELCSIPERFYTHFED